MKKTITTSSLLMAIMVAVGQTIPAAPDARQAQAQDVSDKLKRGQAQAAEMVESNRSALKVTGFMQSEPKPVAPRNKIAENIEWLSKHPAGTNEKVLVDENGVTFMPKKVTREYLQFLRAARPYLLTNYTEADIITNAPDANKVDWKRVKQMPAGMTPEQKDKWLRENMPQLYPENGIKPYHGSGGGDVWTDPVVASYSVLLRPNRAPVAPRLPIVTPSTNCGNVFKMPLLDGCYDMDWSKPAPSLMVWSDGTGTNNHAHFFTNSVTPYQLDFHDVGNGFLAITFPEFGVNPYVEPNAFVGGTIEWEIVHDPSGTVAGTNKLMFEPGDDYTDWNVIVDVSHISYFYSEVRAVRDSRHHVPWPATMTAPQIMFPEPYNPKPDAVEIPGFTIQGAAFSDVVVIGSPSLDGFATNAVFQTMAQSDASGVVSVALNSTNTQMFWTVISTNQIVSPP